MINEKYLIKNKLGKGRSDVFLCEDIDLPGKDIAIKILPPNADSFETDIFKNEFFTLLKLNHPNIIRTFDYGSIQKIGKEDSGITKGSKFFTLEFYNGVELLKLPEVKEEKVLIKIVTQICSVLYYLHLSNYIYYDLKPENVLVSLINKQPFIKIIDMGFAQNVLNNDEKVVRGTAEYIAPEILKNAKHDHRVDFYSLGMVLYRIIYDGFPFSTKNELDIYKAHIEKEFEFPKSDYSKKLTGVIKKLLKKDPSERYGNALEIIDDLGVQIDENLYKDWLPAKIFSNRKDSLTILKTYISDESSNEVFSIRGSEGSGKTALAYKLFSSYENAIFISNNTSLTGKDFLRYSINKIVFNDIIFPKLNKEILKDIDDAFKNSKDFLTKLKSFFSYLSLKSKFILIFDGFNGYDDFTIEIWRSIIPILQVNKIKIILTENTDRQFIANFIFNLREINLTPFTEANLTEYLENSFSPNFPKEDLKRLIISYADLLPGNIESFIKDIILLKILIFKPDGIEINRDEKVVGLLKSSHEEIYSIRFNALTKDEKLISQFTSAFEVSVNPTIISKYFKVSKEEIFEGFSKLEQKNIIHHVQSNSNPIFVSEGLKKFIYSTILDKKTLHGSIAKFLADNFQNFGKSELARHFELSDNYEMSYQILNDELKQAETVSAYSYERKILEHLSAFPLSIKDKLKIKLELSNIYFKLSQYQSAISLIETIINDKIDQEKKSDLLFLKARCLIGLTNYSEGKEIIDELLIETKDPKKRHNLLLEAATVEFNLNQYDIATKICQEIINDKATEYEEKGLTYQMLGLLAVYKNNDLESALNYFEKGELAYEKGKLNFRTAEMQMNIGIVFNIQGNHDKAKLYWDKSLETNRSIGNLEQEAKLLMNYGVFYYEVLDLDKSIESYEKALSIFTSLGNKKGYGSLLFNLSEIYLLICEYQKAVDYLNTAVNTFKQLKNKEEELEALYLLGKLNFVVGDFENLNSIANKYEKYSEKNKLSEKYQNYYQLLVILNQTRDDFSKDYHESLNSLKNFFYEEKNDHDFFFCTMLLVKNFIHMNNLIDANKILHSEELVELCNNNPIFDVERNYMIGKIAELNPSLNKKSNIDYFLDAYDKISNTFITEITWKILYSLTKIYYDRGNVTKAREYKKYALSLINFIAENIKDFKLRNTYLHKTEREEALKNLETIEI